MKSTKRSTFSFRCLFWGYSSQVPRETGEPSALYSGVRHRVGVFPGQEAQGKAAPFLHHLPGHVDIADALPPGGLLAELLRPPLLEQLVGFLVGGVPEASLVLQLGKGGEGLLRHGIGHSLAQKDMIHGAGVIAPDEGHVDAAVQQLPV